jgi:CBS domain containing-hemolysin-like protein
MIFAVPEDLVLTQQAFAEIFSQGYSRVPVYESQSSSGENKLTAMKGVLMTRQLIMVDWEDERAVSTLPLYIPPCVSPRMNLVSLLHLLRKGGSLIAFVCAGEWCVIYT